MYIVFAHHINEIFDIAIVLFNRYYTEICICVAMQSIFTREFNVDGV